MLTSLSSQKKDALMAFNAQKEKLSEVTSIEEFVSWISQSIRLTQKYMGFNSDFYRSWWEITTVDDIARDKAKSLLDSIIEYIENNDVFRTSSKKKWMGKFK